MSNNINILIVGAGLIAEEYVKVATNLGYSPTVIGKGQKNIARLKKVFPHLEIYHGGIDNWLETNNFASHAIVATNVEFLADIVMKLLKSGVKKILAEKPLALDTSTANNIRCKAIEMGAEVYIAYNRRFYTTVIKAINLIKTDGGLSSFHFNFTEALFRINTENYYPSVLSRWGITNSSHVIDTAFFIAGDPDFLYSEVNGSGFDWHPSGSKFTGMGYAPCHVPFTYNADWSGPGRWSLEFVTSARKLILSPMEKLREQRVNTFEITEVNLDLTCDNLFKPGYYNQVKEFLFDGKKLMNLNMLISRLEILKKIFNY